MTPRITTFVQARMSSRRFPGKVLAPLWGRPVIWHTLRAVQEALPSWPVVVATSVEPSDDPLAAYVSSLDVPIFRGSLVNVFQRFRDCLDVFPCEWLVRISADSPLLAPSVLAMVVDRIRDENVDADLVTTVFPRTFPAGQNVELIRARTFRSIQTDALTDHDLEHVTPFFYRNADRFRIVNVSSGLHQDHASLAVDEVGDLERLESFTGPELQAFANARRS